MHVRCLKCRYIRDGLGPREACPECGEPAPPPEWIVVHGTSVTLDRRWSLAGAILAFVAVGGLAFGAWQQRSPPLLVNCIVFAVFGMLALVRVIRTWSPRSEGGDLIWVVKPDSLEMRGFLRTLELPWRQVQWAHYERGFARHLARLSVTPRGAIAEGILLGIWLDVRDVDTRALHALLRQRIGAAAPHEAKVHA